MCDAGFDDAAVVGLAGAGDEGPLLHAVEKARHVGVMRNHAFADGAAREAVWFGAAEDAKDVVLRAGEAVWLEKLLGFEAEGVGRLLEGYENAVLQGKREMGGAAAAHGA